VVISVTDAKGRDMFKFELPVGQDNCSGQSRLNPVEQYDFATFMRTDLSRQFFFFKRNARCGATLLCLTEREATDTPVGGDLWISTAVERQTLRSRGCNRT
jgi:hypothetical protein